MKRIIFVDDEPHVLAGLKRMLRGKRREWDMSFAGSGAEALERLASEDYDVIVSDMRMPGMDGATLLARVQEAHPEVVRIVLSGYAELEAALRAVSVAHQFLTKPCEPNALSEVIERACGLQEILANTALQQAVGQIDSLPVLPRLYTELTAALVDPEVSFDDVADIVERDVGITAKVIQLANSSLFGLARRIASIREAVPYLGVNMIRNLTLSIEVFHEFEGCAVEGFSIEQEQAHAVLTASIASKMLDDKAAAELACTAAMLHDVGRLILVSHAPQVYAKAVAAAKGSERPFFDVEEEVNGVSHAEIGGYLLGLWGMPYPIVEAVANHHRPGRVRSARFDVLGAVHVADALALELQHFGLDAMHGQTGLLDTDFLENAGVTERVAQWRELAASEHEKTLQGEREGATG